MAEYRKEPIPEEFRSLAEAGVFWDTHSAADYIDDLTEVEMDFALEEGQFMVPMDSGVYSRIKDRAKREHRSISEMIDILLQRELTA